MGTDAGPRAAYGFGGPYPLLMAFMLRLLIGGVICLPIIVVIMVVAFAVRK